MVRKSVAFILVFFTLLSLSCSLLNGTPVVNNDPPVNNNPVVATTDPQIAIDQAVAATQAVQTQVALSVQQTMAAQVTNTPSITPSITPSPTSELPHVTVSVNTNCRSGPGSAYAILGALDVGQSAEVVGRSQSSDNWIIRLPATPTVICWLWGQYATVTGSTASLPVITAPPTPTTAAPTTITITIYNNTGVTIFYAYISESADPSWGSDELGSSTISAGGSFSWTYSPGVYDVKVEDSAHNMLESWMGVSMYSDQYLVAGP